MVAHLHQERYLLSVEWYSMPDVLIPISLRIDNVRYTTLTHQQVLMETAFQSLELAE
jgi:hypothetical protein